MDASVSSKRLVAGGGGALLDTVTVTGADVVWLPAASRATAVSVCEPSLEAVVSTEIEYGAEVSSAPSAAPSPKNRTPTTPTLSDALAEIVTVPFTVTPFAGAVMVTVGGVVRRGALFTVTVTAAEVVRFPAASRATAVRVCWPLLDPVVLTEIAYGAVVSSAPRAVPSEKNCTPATPTLSEALADTAIVPETVAPLAGAVMLTAGGVVSGGGPLDTITVTAAEVVRFPAASRATAVRVCWPLLDPVVLTEIAYGAVVSSAPRAVPSEKNCTPATPTLSEALADTAIVPETVAPLAGAVMLTAGGVVSGGGPLDTITVTAAEVVRFPAASRATAVRVCWPLLDPVVLTEIAYGAVVSSAPRAVPSEKNCTPATPTLSEALADTAIVPETVAPLAGAVMLTAGGVVSGGGPLDTITVTAAEVVRFPAASRATAVRVCWPLLDPVVLTEIAYGAVVSSAPRAVPSEKNCTPATPTLSEALADTVMVPDTVAPLAGAVRLTAGGVVSGGGALFTVTVTEAEVVRLPAASRATALKVCAPLPTLPVFHETENGALVSSAPSATPSLKNCTPATPTLSEAFADTVMVPDTVAPFAGAVRLTAGGVVSGGGALFTVTVIGFELNCKPSVAVATALSVCEPLLAPAVFQEIE